MAGTARSGFLNVLKAPGETSHSVVGRIRRLIGQRRVGHAGTLDPAAAGVLPIAVGSATRFTMVTGWNLKIYWADICFGSATDTDDAEGRVIATADVEHIGLSQIEESLGSFLGELVQRPPIYSAVRVDGRRSYRNARSGLARPPKERSVTVDAIRIVGWSAPMLSVLVQCRSGTYIRSLARDLGEILGSAAHLAALVRLRVGPFSIIDALSYEELEAVANRNSWDEILWPSDVPLRGVPALFASEERERDFGHGRFWAVSTKGTAGQARVYGHDGEFLGLADRIEEQWRPSVVLGSPT